MVHYLRFDWIQLELVDKKCNFGVKYKAIGGAAAFTDTANIDAVDDSS